MDLTKLHEPFPRGEVEWRAQTLTQDGSKALALAYIDARAVMHRLDNVCGPENWQDSYAETPSGRVLCTIAIKIGDEWVGKCDGAGSTDIEGEKGGISGAFKRAAVKWGVGRYLYDLDAVWVPCETYERNGKKHWKKWSADPWSFVRNPPAAPSTSAPNTAEPREQSPSHEEAVQEALRYIPTLETLDALQAYWKNLNATSGAVEDKRVIDAKDKRKAELSEQQEGQAA